MTAVVLDASTAVSWIVRSQASATADAVLLDPSVTRFEAPHIFPDELRNALLKLERQHKSDAADTEDGLAMIAGLGVVVRPAPDASGASRLVAAARATRLSYYDVQYLELAQRQGLRLVSRDRALLSAAVERGVAVIATLEDEA